MHAKVAILEANVVIVRLLLLSCVAFYFHKIYIFRLALLECLFLIFNDSFFLRFGLFGL